MSSSAEKILYRKAALIFEELGFLLPRAESYETDGAAFLSARVSFQGPFAGDLIVSISDKVLSILAANMMGDDRQVDESFEKDALREISNVICGNALPAIYGAEKVFHLDAPVLFEEGISASVESEYARDAHVSIGFEQGFAEITLFVQNA
jgi:CheY-specific phosphatase CheX